MRNYVFIRNRDALHSIEEHLSKYTVPKASLDVSQNRKGTVITFHNDYWVKRLIDFVEFERNEVGFSLSVEPLTDTEIEKGNALIRSLTRIAHELKVMNQNFEIRQLTRKGTPNGTN
jgi:hypothetical protein